MPFRMDPRAESYDTDVLLRDHRRPLTCVSSIQDVTSTSGSVEFLCDTSLIHRQMRDRYGTNLEIGEVTGAGPEVTVRFDAVTPEVVRMRMAIGRDVPANHTPMLEVETVPSSSATLAEEEDRWIFSTGALVVTVWKDPFRYEIRDLRGVVLRESIPASVYLNPPTGESHLDGRALSDAWPWYFRDLAPLGFVHDPETGESQSFDTAFLGQTEHVYGFGEQFGSLNKRGQKINLWHANAAGETWPLAYKNVPFFMSTVGYGHFTNSSRPITYHVGDLSHVHHSVHVQDDFLDTFVIAGPDLRTVLTRYTALTGVPQVPPTWSFGLWMSRMSYREQREVEGIAERLREERIPCDVIHIDTDWFATEWVNDLAFSPTRFPDPASMIRTLKDQGLRVSLWQLPYISVRSTYFDLCDSNGWFAKDADGRPRLITGFFGPAGVLDFSNPDAAEWYTDQLVPLLEMGIAAIKTDFGEGAPVDATYHGIDGLSMHNLYPLLYNRAVFEKTVETTGESIIWGRSAYAGSQRYSVYWGGDPTARWQDLGQLLSGGLGLGLCGFPFWSQDIGGFAGTPSPDLYIRWAQFGLFMTHPRAHGATPREPWAFGDEAVRIFRQYAELRYRLLPYIVSEARVLAPLGEPVMRPLLLDNQDDPTTWEIADQFMFGRNLLIAPITTPDGRRRVYLPKGRWARWDHHTRGTATVHQGPAWIEVEAAIDELPMFLPEGVVLPLVAQVQHTGELSYDAVEAHVVLGPVMEPLLLSRDEGEDIRLSTRFEGEKISLDVDPSVNWTIFVHGLTWKSVDVSFGEGAQQHSIAADDHWISIECPPSTTTIELVESGSDGGAAAEEGTWTSRD